MASITDVAHLDTVLIVDGTYYVHEAGLGQRVPHPHGNPTARVDR